MTKRVIQTGAVQLVDVDGNRVMVPLYAIARAHEQRTEEKLGGPMECIQTLVAKHFGFSVTDLKSGRRYKELVYARHVAMYLCEQLSEYTMGQVARAYGGRDHTSAIHGARRIGKLIEVDDKAKADVELLRALIMGEMQS